MTDDGVQGFLEAEEAASNLLAELTKLKQETESYTTSRDALSEVSAALAQHVARTAELVSQTKDVVTRLGEIGTPQLLEGQRQLQDELGKLLESQRELGEGQHQSLESQRALGEGQDQLLEALHQVREVQDRLLEDQQKMRREMSVGRMWLLAVGALVVILGVSSIVAAVVM